MAKHASSSLIPVLLVVLATAPARADWTSEEAISRYQKAADYSAANNGVSVVVQVDGRIVFERYESGHSVDTPNNLASGTKGFWGPAIAILVAEGRLGLDDKVADTITEWQSDPVKSRITVRQVLTLSSGLGTDMSIQGDGGEPDKYGAAIRMPMAHAPDEDFVYGPVNFYVLGEIIRRQTQGDPLAYLKDRILDPLGIRIGAWVRDDTGNPNIPNGADITARDWAKLGQFVLQGGEWNGKQIVPAALVIEILTPSAQNPGYGLTWWLNTPGGEGSRPSQRSRELTEGGLIYPAGYPDMVGTLGAGPNILIVIPSIDMVIVRHVPWHARPAHKPWEEWRREQASVVADFNTRVFLSHILSEK